MRGRHGRRGWALLALFVLLAASVVVGGGIEDFFIQQGATIDVGVCAATWSTLLCTLTHSSGVIVPCGLQALLRTVMRTVPPRVCYSMILRSCRSTVRFMWIFSGTDY